MRKLFIVILDYNGHENTKELLESLKKVKKGDFNFNVVVVDNYPQDPIRIDEKEYKEINLKVLFNERNLGFSGGNNVGISYSLQNRADLIIFLNNDTIVDENFAIELVKTADKNKDAGIITPKIYFAKGYEFHKNRYKEDDLGKIIWYAGGSVDWANIIGHNIGVDEVDKGQFDKEIETEIASGCCFLIKKEVLDKIGEFDEKYFLYYEDAELSLRAKKAGFKIIFCPEAIVWHKNAMSSGGSGSKLQDYFITRNRLMFGLRFGLPRAKSAILKESVKLFFTGRKWQRRGILDFYLGRFGKGSFPL